MPKIVVISDVHCKQDSLTIPECDILISCGDYSFRGLPSEVTDFHEWLNKQPAKNIISLQGNHEKLVERNWDFSKQLALDACPRAHFIDEGLIEIEGLKLWCSAITPFFCDWAWNRHRGIDIKKHWDRIPNDIDILVTHGPPYGILDEVDNGPYKENVGCLDLWNKIQEIPILRYHFFGHIHSGYGFKEENGVKFYNTSICDERYKAVNKPIVLDI